MASTFTIGHSNHPIGVFIALLKTHRIEVVVDSRSYPRSKYAPHFDAEALRYTLPKSRIEYLFLGNELGGRPEGSRYYDADGRVLYGQVAEAPFFQRGLARLQQEMQRARVAVMCSEEDPAVCHRHLLIARVLRDLGITLQHIRADGRVQSEDELVAVDCQPQLSLFDFSPVPEWKSIRSVLPKRPHSSSLAS